MSTSTADRADTDTVAAPAGVVAVVAHRKKTFGGGLDELRARLATAGVGRLIWHEVPKSRKAPKRVRAALDEGADLVLVWGGDGMVQRCADALAGTGVPMGILPAGTANLFAANLGIPADLPEAVRIALHGRRRRLDLGRLNGEHFAVMAGAGFDGDLIRDADRKLKGRFGRVAYVWTALRHVRGECVRTRIRVDGSDWFDGDASCVLFGNVGTITGGIPAFDDARPDDGVLEVGVATASGAVDWARTLGRMAAGRSDDSPFVRITRGRKIRVRFAAPKTYELDGGARGTAKRLKVTVVPGGLTVCCPDPVD
ncbi:diacylglycerol/lipid kinase family protein [Micromonospora sediminicola]|uniref:diacylglycerol/lipid kinase family protein n=1 Tax=Micromonospora sediminicola TaxID=946078 RepID=UPI0033A1F3BD